MYFQLRKVDAAVIEVGLGGRLDATNVVHPVVSVITSISYDHTQLLGNTLTLIAGEKAGIIKPGIPVVASPQEEEARQVIEHVCRERGSTLVQVGRDILYQSVSKSLEGQSIQVWSADENQKSAITLSFPLLGAHQAANAATAYAALKIYDRDRLKLAPGAIKRGFSNAFWPGRFEIVQRNPPVVLDCAHNRDSALKLHLTLDEYYPGKCVILVFGASEDKDIAGMFSELMPSVKELIAVKSFHPRAIDPDKLVEMAHTFGHPVTCFEDIPQAVEEALQMVSEDDLVLVTGSIFVVAEARKYWESKAKIRSY
jgi:dihydrofolate synthase/folylpolyglutamate synthase